MQTSKLKYWPGFALLMLVTSFTFYKSSVEELELDNHKNNIEDMQRLQIQLHRDLLNYRSGSISEYDTLNRTQNSLLEAAALLATQEINGVDDTLAKNIKTLETSLKTQQVLVEDFKIHHSILQNSMSYYSRLSSKLYGDGKHNKKLSAEILGNLSRLILEFSRMPTNKTALKLYGELDKLNRQPDREVKTLINHSLLIVEKLPDIDSILEKFNRLNVEGQIQNIFQIINELQSAQNMSANLYNALLFIITLGILSYLLLTFHTLQKSRDTLSSANSQLSKEAKERARTENSLLKFVTHSAQDYREDHVHCILNALCKSLDVRYAQIITLNSDSNTGASADIVDNFHFKRNQPAVIIDTADEDTLARGRLAYNDELQNYFPATKHSLLQHASSYIGITLKSNTATRRVIAIADDKPIDNISLYENILSIAASRMSIELSRHLAMENSIRYQRGLERIDYWVAQLFTHSKDKSAFTEAACKALHDVTNSSLATLCEVQSTKDSYVHAAVCGNNGEKLLGTERIIEDGGVCSWAIKYNENVCINDLASDIRVKRKFITDLNVQHAMLAPIMLAGEVYGCLVAFREKKTFDSIDQHLLTQFCQSMEMALNNMMLLGDLQSQKERAELTLHSIADAIITTDASGNIDYLNHVAEHLCGTPLEMAIGQSVQNVFRIIDSETHELQHKLSDSCLLDGTSINKSTTTLIAQDDSEREIECSMSPIRTSANIIDGIVIVFHDETERRRLEYQTKHQASHDSLTGLLNRNEFIRNLNEHIFDARDTGRIHIVCYLDLDRFKLVNDSAGHGAGDELLIQVTHLIHSCIRGGDILARLGGDEFGLILRSCSVDSARHITQKIVDKIQEYELHWEAETFTIGVSIGLAAIDSNTQNVTEATKQADMACYTAKDRGRNRIYVYERNDTELLGREEVTRWADKISEALNNDRFKLYAQPICPLSDNDAEYQHLEVLVRMLDANGTLIAPNAFIPTSERYKLMAIVDQHIIQKTFEHISSRKQDENIRYSINLSGNSLNDENIIQNISKKIQTYNIDPARLCFEITETAAVTNLVNARNLINEIRKLGCQIALDDFGSNFSSFEYLKNLPVDYLKIDGSFVRDMANNKIDHAMVAAINQVGHIMGIKTIAEFSENEIIIHKLQLLNVDFAQGYGISRPAPIEEFSFEQLSGQHELIKRRALTSG